MFIFKGDRSQMRHTNDKIKPQNKLNLFIYFLKQKKPPHLAQ